MRLFLSLAVCLAPLLALAEDPEVLSHPNEAELARVYKRYASLDDPTTFTFCVMGDSRDGVRFHKKLIGQLNEEKDALFVLNNGDLVSKGKRSQYVAFLEEIKDAKLPYLVTPGNHDYQNNGEKHYAEIFGARYYSFDLGKNRFLMMDNGGGDIDDEQLDWMDEQMDTAKRCFVFAHHPPALGEWKLHCFREGARRWMEIIGRRKPARVYVSHIHAYDVKKWKGVTFVLTGGAGSPQTASFLVPGVTLGFHYMRVTVTPDGVKDEKVDMKE